MNDIYKQLSELEEKIKEAAALRDVTSHIERPEAFEARTDELKVLIRQEIGILQNKEKELFDYIDLIKKETDKLLGNDSGKATVTYHNQ